jgi:hypothetical protein
VDVAICVFVSNKAIRSQQGGENSLMLLAPGNSSRRISGLWVSGAGWQLVERSD